MDQNQTDNSEPISTEGKKQLCYEVIKETYDFTLARMDGWDTKANNLCIIAGVLIGLYLGFGKGILDSIDKTKVISVNLYFFDGVKYYNLMLYILLIGLALLLASIGLALFGYRGYPVQAAPDSTYFYEHYATNEVCTKSNILDVLSTVLVETNKTNTRSAADKGYIITWSLIMLLAGSVVFVIFVFFALISTRT